MTMSTEVIRNGRRLKAMPLPRDFGKKQRHFCSQKYEPEWVLLPTSKVILAPFGVREPRQLAKATEVVSQIAANVILGRSRVGIVVEWRMALYYALTEVFPTMSRNKASKIMRRDRSTLIHYERKRIAQPDYLADQVKAIKGVLI